MAGVNGDVCPTCGSSEIDELGRITGYLFGTVNQANAGKQDEFKDRVDHTDSLVGWARH